MKRSNARYLTTHAGSLPRPKDLLTLTSGAEPAVLEARIRSSVRAAVMRQVEAGVDVVSDGEMSKPSYATYVKDRLTGFGGQGRVPSPADLGDYPTYASHLMADAVLRTLDTPACTGPVAYCGESAVQRDTENFRAALEGQPVAQGFLTAASPGVIALFHENRYYPSHEAYIEALAEAMRVEYRLIHNAGFLLQIDAPDLAMGHHTQFASLSVREFRKIAELHVAALNHALAGIPARSIRLHVCWGNYQGPHHRDIELAQIVDIVLKAHANGLSFAAANPRHEHEWQIWEGITLPPGKILIPGVVDPTTHFVEHPELIAERIHRFARIVGKDGVIAGTDCGLSTFAGYSLADPAIAWAKLEALAAGARLAALRLSPVRHRKREPA